MSSTSDSDVALAMPVKLAARKSSERKNSDLKERGPTSVEGSLRWRASIGPWESGTYEFRYFDAGWDRRSDSLLFVPGRGCVAKSPPFKVEKLTEPCAIRILKPLDPPPVPRDDELASHAWRLREVKHFEELKERKKRDNLVEIERAAGLHRGFTTVKAQYKGKWYKGEFVRSKLLSDTMKFGVQCDSDPKGTITWVTSDKLKIIQGEEKPESWGML